MYSSRKEEEKMNETIITRTDSINSILNSSVLVNVKLLDFLIVGDTYYSFLENGLLT